MVFLDKDIILEEDYGFEALIIESIGITTMRVISKHFSQYSNSLQITINNFDGHSLETISKQDFLDNSYLNTVLEKADTVFFNLPIQIDDINSTFVVSIERVEQNRVSIVVGLYFIDFVTDGYITNSILEELLDLSLKYFYSEHLVYLVCGIEGNIDRENPLIFGVYHPQTLISDKRFNFAFENLPALKNKAQLINLKHL